jgi:hypothetical protein
MNNFRAVYDFLPVIFLAAFVVWVVELILSVTWNRFYFSVGLPIFIRRMPVVARRIAPLDIDIMKTELPVLLFKEMGTNLYAFRERFFQLYMGRSGLTGAMHGIVVLDQTGRQVVVKVFFPWYHVVLLPGLAWISLSVGGQVWLYFLTYLILLGMTLAVQISHFGEMARTIAIVAESARRA